MINEYYYLKAGELVKDGDEVLLGGWNELEQWQSAKGGVGHPAPDPSFPAHCIYRRKIMGR